MELMFNQFLSGLIRAALLFLVTSGLTLVFGVMGTMNMAHFSFYMIAAYMSYTFWRILTPNPYSFWITLIFTATAMIIIGLVFERLIMRRIYNRILPEQLLATFALTYVFSDITKVLWGLEFLQVPKSGILNGSVLIFGSSMPNSNIFILALGITIALGIWFILSKTKFGRIVRACYSHKEMVGALGIPVGRVYAAVFCLSALLVSLAGTAWTTIGSINLGLDQSLLIEAFCVMVIGGMGSFLGTTIGCLIAGMIYSYSILIVPRLATLLIFVITGIILTVRPWGLFGTKGRFH